MQKKNIKIGKRITALIMCAVLLATTMPFMIASAVGTYNPIPAWPADKADRGVSAYTNADGGITVDFPAATANTTYRAKTVTGYLLELVDLGAYDTLHTETTVLNKLVSPTGAAPYEAEIAAAEIAAVLPDGLDENHRYNITITAVDSDGWFSDELNTIVSDVPKFIYDADLYSPIIDYAHAMREMMTFDSGSGSVTGTVTGGQLQLGSVENQTGVEDPTSATDKDSNGFRTRIIGVPTVQQTFETEWSRQTWDFTGTKEVWFWLDFSQAFVTGVSFRLRTQMKELVLWADTTLEQSNNGASGGVLYATDACTASDMYVYVQRADGGWDKVKMTNGTLDLDHFKGYIRIPVEYFCSTAATYVDGSNLKTGESFSVKATTQSATQTNLNNYVANNNLKFSTSYLVDPAGTPITDALLLQTETLKANSTFGQTASYSLGTILAAGVAETDIKNSSNTARAYIDTATGTVQNRENGYKAIEDLCTAGFAFTGCSADSVDKALFMDNVLFYKDNDDPYPENTLNGSVNTGNSVATYFDQTKEIPRAIFNACETYFNDPNWSDYRAVAYIENLIAGYKQAYSDAGVDITFLEESNLTAAAANLAMTDSWNLFLDARQKCQEADTYTKDNNEPDDLVPMLEQELEKLPDPATLYSMSDAMKEEVERLHKIYGKLNLGQLDNLGAKAENRLIAYFTYLETVLQENSMPVGQVLTDNPFIPFADFEQETVGTRAWQLENDSQNFNNVGYDYRYLKSFVTYTPETFEDFTGYSSDTTSSSLTSADATLDGFSGSLMQNGAWAYITENGFQGSNGATMTVDSQAYASGEGYYNIMSFSYMGANSATFDEQRAQNMGQSTIKLGSLAKAMSGAVSPPLSLVFYADFSQLSDIRVAFTISTYYGGQCDDFAMDMSNDSASRLFYLLDPASGEWVAANNADCQYALTSSGGADTDGDGIDDLSLRNYKGFVMIPLYHFKKGGEVWNRGLKLDETAEALDTIWRISIGVAPGSNAGAADLDGKTFTVDNIGFSYDPVYYADVVASRGITDMPFDEIFKAKALPSEQFEEAVTAIDPYDDTTLATATANARAMYEILSAYQKTRSSVVKAEALLQTYELWVTDPSARPAPALEPTALDAAIEALPAQAKAADNVANANDLPYPGFVFDDVLGAYRVNYEAYGITAEQADEIISMYTDSYKRFTTTQKAALTLKPELINAYNAAMRCKNLENMLVDLKAFKADLLVLYENARVDDVAGDGSSDNFIKTDAVTLTKLAELEAAYNNLDYFAKVLLQDGSFNPIYSEAANAIKRVLKNAKAYALADGSTLQGGIPTTVARYTDLITRTSTTLTNQVLFTAAELQELDTTIEEYKNMLATYYAVDDMNLKIAELLALFDVHQTSVTATEISLSKDMLNGASTYQVEYSEQYPLPASGKENYIAFTSQNGAMLNGANTLDYKVDITVGGVTQTYTAAQLLAGIPAAQAKADYTVANNTYDPVTPFAVELKAYLDTAPTGLSGVYTDTLVATLVDADGNMVYDRAGQPIQKTITVRYAGEDTYTVTYPAEVAVAWNDTNAQDAKYTVTSSLEAGAKLAVSATANNSGTMTAAGTADTLTFTVQNGDAQDFTGENTDATSANPPTVTIPDFSGKSVGNYTGTMTYTVVYTPAP